MVVGGNKRSADPRHLLCRRPQDGCGGGAGTYDPTDSSKKRKRKMLVPPERSEARFVLVAEPR
jgi:hypothetical protein